MTKDSLGDVIFSFLDFPKTADQRVYHLGVRPGEVANRIVSRGAPETPAAESLKQNNLDHRRDPIPGSYDSEFPRCGAQDL